MITLYRFKLSLLEPHYPINDLHRIIDVQGDVAFDGLSAYIRQLFAMDDTAWQFVIARQKTDSLGKLSHCQEIIAPDDFPSLDTSKTLHNPKATLDTLGLEAKDYLYLWCHGKADFVFRLRLEKLSSADMLSDPITLIKSVGDVPNTLQTIAQEPTANTPNPNTQNTNVQNNTQSTTNDPASDQDFEMLLVSALMLIAVGGNGEPVRWQELVDNGVADELVKRGLIKPCVNPTHLVKMTPFGESELANFMQMTGLA